MSARPVLQLVFAILYLQACATSTSQQIELSQVATSVVAIGDDQAAIASGFVVEGGWLLTNHHVARAAPLYIVNAQGKRSLLTLVISDEENDIAIFSHEMSIPALKLTQSLPDLGETVFVLGNPLGLGITATHGIISALPRAIGKVHLLQTDAPINPGNSGGPLINQRGEVVGMVTSRGAVGSGIGFAVPSATLRRLLNKL